MSNSGKNHRLNTLILNYDAINTSEIGICVQGAVRLNNGSATRGRVEVCNNDVWGTVCNDSWTSVEARVVCAQLGLPTSGIGAVCIGYQNCKLGKM